MFDKLPGLVQYIIVFYSIHETILILRSLKCFGLVCFLYQYTKVVLDFKEALLIWALL